MEPRTEPRREPEPESALETGQPGTGPPTRELAVQMCKWRIVMHVLFAYGLIVGVVLVLFFFAGETGMWMGFSLLALALPYVLWGATLLYERRPVVVVNTWTGILVRHSALFGEKFVPLGPSFRVAWDVIDRWEVTPWRLFAGVPTGVSLLRVYLRNPGAFVRSQGWLCGRLRFFAKHYWFGTPVVLSDMMLNARANAIAEFMEAAVHRHGRHEGNVIDADLGPARAVPLMVVQQ